MTDKSIKCGDRTGSPPKWHHQALQLGLIRRILETETETTIHSIITWSVRTAATKRSMPKDFPWHMEARGFMSASVLHCSKVRRDMSSIDLIQEPAATIETTFLRFS
jgi:hypothetical protein